jgi:hypothetical protein
MGSDALTAAVFAVARASEAAGWGEPSIAAGVSLDGRPVFVGLVNAAVLRKSGVAKLIDALPTSTSELTPAQLEPANVAVSCSSIEELFFGSSIHVHVALIGSEAVVIVTAPAALSNLEAFKDALEIRLTAPNDFD